MTQLLFSADLMLYGAGRLLDELSPFQIPCLIAFLWRSGTRAKPWCLIGARGWQGDGQSWTSPPWMLGKGCGLSCHLHGCLHPSPELSVSLRGGASLLDLRGWEGWALLKG